MLWWGFWTPLLLTRSGTIGLRSEGEIKIQQDLWPLHTKTLKTDHVATSTMTPDWPEWVKSNLKPSILIGTAFAIYAIFDIKASQKYFRLVLLHGPLSGHILWSDKFDKKLELPLQAKHPCHQRLVRAHLCLSRDSLECGICWRKLFETEPSALLPSIWWKPHELFLESFFRTLRNVSFMEN